MPTVTTNTAANSALRLLNQNSMKTGASISRLASGNRIVTAADNAAGLAIGTRLRADHTVLAQAARNAAQGISVVQVADGGLARIVDILQRLKVLVAQSLSGVPTDKERAFIQAEYSQLIGEINGTARSTRFNGESLLDGSGEQFSRPVDFLVGTSVKDAMTLDVSNLAKRVPAFTSEHLGGLARPAGTSTAFASAASTAAGQAVADRFSQTHAVTEINRLIQVADAATTATVTTVSIGGVAGVDAASLAAGPARVETLNEARARVANIFGSSTAVSNIVMLILGPRRDALSAEIDYLTGGPPLSSVTGSHDYIDPNSRRVSHNTLPPYRRLHWRWPAGDPWPTATVVRPNKPGRIAIGGFSGLGYLSGSSVQSGVPFGNASDAQARTYFDFLKHHAVSRARPRGAELTAAQRTAIDSALRRSAVSHAQTTAFDSAVRTFEHSMATATPGIDTTSVSNTSLAAQAFAVIDRAIDQVSEARANVGAIISRFGFRGQQIATSHENIVAAQSSILDVDVAAEQSRLAVSQVLVQASVAALSQANKLPQSLLRLLS